MPSVKILNELRICFLAENAESAENVYLKLHMPISEELCIRIKEYLSKILLTMKNSGVPFKEMHRFIERKEDPKKV